MNELNNNQEEEELRKDYLYLKEKKELVQAEVLTFYILELILFYKFIKTNKKIKLLKNEHFRTLNDK